MSSTSRPLKMLDGFCGMGGMSDGFAAEGFDVTGIDLVNAPEMGYKYKFIQADFLTLDGADFRDYDVIHGSPPCREFTEFARIYGKTWKTPPNPERGLVLVNAFLKFIERAQPKFWIMENVSGLTKYYTVPPRINTYLSLGANNMGKKHAFWGNFPLFLMPKDQRKKAITYHKIINGKRCPKSVNNGKYGKWVNAKLPLACSQAFAKACKDALLTQEVTCIL